MFVRLTADIFPSFRTSRVSEISIWVFFSCPIFIPHSKVLWSASNISVSCSIEAGNDFSSLKKVEIITGNTECSHWLIF